MPGRRGRGAVDYVRVPRDGQFTALRVLSGQGFWAGCVLSALRGVAGLCVEKGRLRGQLVCNSR